MSGEVVDYARAIVPDTAETAANYAVAVAGKCVVRITETDPSMHRDLVRYFADNAATVAKAVQVATYGPGAPPDWVSAAAIGMSDAWGDLSRALRGVGQ